MKLLPGTFDKPNFPILLRDSSGILFMAACFAAVYGFNMWIMAPYSGRVRPEIFFENGGHPTIWLISLTVPLYTVLFLVFARIIPGYYEQLITDRS